MAVKAERSVLLAFMYLAVSMYIAALIWMNLLYGVKLSQDVAAGWVKAALAAQPAVLWQPVGGYAIHLAEVSPEANSDE